MTQSLRSLAALSLLAAAACNSYQPRWSTNPSFNNPVGSFTLALDQPSIEVYDTGAPATLHATVTPAGGFTGVLVFTPVGDEHLGLVITPDSVDVEGTAPVTVELSFTPTHDVGAMENIQLAAAADNQSAEAPLLVNPVIPGGGTIGGPDALSFVVGGPAQDLHITADLEDIGPFAESDTCAGIATVTPGAMAMRSADYSVAPLAAGTCVVSVSSNATVPDAGNLPTKQTTVTVTGN